MKLELGNTATYSNQSVFDYAVAHMAAQGRRSTNGDSRCLYRGPDGLMCAVGCLIPDEEYSPSLEDMVVMNITPKQLPQALLPYGDNTLLHQLQRCHDQALSPSRLREMLTMVAEDFSLDQSAIEGITKWEK